MKTQVSKLVTDVLTELKEVDPNEAAFVGDKDNADLETRIASKIEATVDEVHLRSPMKDLSLDAAIDIIYDASTAGKGFIYKSTSGILTVMLKSHTEGFEDHTHDIDMLKMVCARAESWPFDVRNVVFPDDPLYEIVTDKYVGAQSDFPAVTQRKKAVRINGERAMMTTLELRCLNAADEWAHITVIPHAKIEDGMVNIDSKVYCKVVREIAQKIENQE